MIKNTKDKVLTIIFTLLILYFIISLLGGNRGLFSYFEKKNFLTKLEYEKITLSQEIEELEKSNGSIPYKITPPRPQLDEATEEPSKAA